MDRTTNQKEDRLVLAEESPPDDIVLVTDGNNGDSAKTNGENVELVMADVSTETGVTEWFKKLPRLVQSKFFKLILRSARPEVLEEVIGKEKKFASWRSITIGGMSKISLFRKLWKAPILVSWWAEQALMRQSFKVSRREGRVRLILLSAADLGLDETSTVNDLVETMTAQRLAEWSTENLNGRRLSLCPVELAARLRYIYLKQPEGECVLVVSKPILLSDGSSAMFAVERGKNENPSLQVMLMRPEEPDRRLSPGIKIAFLLRKQRLKRSLVSNT